jgi:putative transposase
MANRHLVRAVGDIGFREFRRQMEYKVLLYSGRLIVADRWCPSNKKCSKCDYVLESLPLSARVWTCPCCGTEHDRDFNASKNLAKLAVSSTVTACGGGSNGIVQLNDVKLTPMKQKSNTKLLIDSFE